MVKLNEYQTPIEDLNLHLCPEEVQEQFMEYLTSVPFIRNLTSPDRPRCKDLPRDEQGRAIIDITNPPILEDMDYFRPTALHWERDGTLTSLRPNPNPNSEFGKWMKREVDRIWNGMVRPSDGMWITGDDYFYLNYSLIELSEEVEGTDIADRIIAMPKVWEGVWWRHLYWYSARQKALNAAEIAKRGASKAHPYCQEVITPDGVKLWGDIKVGDILFGDDGKPTKVIDIPFDGEADIYELTLRDGRKILASDEHLWRLKVHNFKEEQVWNTKKIIENYARKRKKNDRNPNGIEYICGIPANKEINFPHKETKVDPYTFGLLLGDGCFRHQSCYFTQAEEDIKIEKSYIPYEIIKWNNYLQHRICIPNWLDIIKSYGLYNKKSEYKFIPEEYKFNSKKVRLSILKGLMDSDGYLGKHDVYTISTVSKELAEDIRWICWSLGYNTTCTKQKAGYKKNGEYKECLPTYIISIYTCDAIANLPRKIRKTKFSCNYAKNRAVQSRIINIEYKGKMPAKCVTIDNKSHCYLIGDFVVTHNSYSVASKLAKIFILGENFKSCKGIKGMVVAYAKEYLTKDGTLNKFEFMIDSLQELAPWWPNKTLQRSLSDMNWQMGYIDSVTGGKRGTKNLILGVAVKDDPDKPRGKRPHPYYCNVLTTEGIKKWGDLQIGDYVYGNDGKPTKVVAIPFDGEDDIYKITLRDGRTTYAGKDHLFKVKTFITGKEVNRVLSVEELLKGQATYKHGYKYSIPRNHAIVIPEQQVFIDPYVLGLYLGDGCYNQCRADKINLTMLREDFDAIEPYIPYKVSKSVGRDITHYIHLLGGETGDRNYQNFAASLLQYYGLGHKHAGDKFIPRQYLFNSEENRLKLLKGLLDTDGTCTTQGSVEYATKSKQLAEDFMWLCRSLGINCSCYQKTFHRNDNVYYRVKLHTLNRELFNLKRKQDRVRITDSRYMHSFSEKTAIVSIDYVGKQPCKCITVDSESHLYLIDDFITTHNSVFIGAEEFGAFPKILDTYNVMLPSVREGGKAFGMMALIGTGGSEGNDFSGALEMIYKPKGYHILGLPNVWDKVNKGIGESIFFFPAYVNRAGCYDRNGNSDVTKALLEILMDWYNAKYNTSDPMQVVRTKAENPITIQDAIMRRDNTVFPVSDLIERIGELDANPSEFDDVYVGEMCLKSDGTAYFKPNRDKPLREFPHKGNKHEGAVEIFKMPEKNRDGRVFAGRYIAGLDPIDNDLARSTTSLISCFILDLWTDQIVAEWTGRLDMADDGYEVCRRLAMFYNAKICYENNKKGLYSYFKTMNSLYLLAPNLEFLKDKDKVKGENYGNTAYGVNAGTFVNDFARERLNNWFRKPVKRIVIQDGNEVEVTRMNLYYCRNRALLQEASQWNPDGNFDRVSACGMLMLYREECLIKCGGNPMETEKKKQSESQGEKDDYFDRNWHGKK